MDELLEEYGLEWRVPRQMNDEFLFGVKEDYENEIASGNEVGVFLEKSMCIHNSWARVKDPKRFAEKIGVNVSDFELFEKTHQNYYVMVDTEDWVEKLTIVVMPIGKNSGIRNDILKDLLESTEIYAKYVEDYEEDRMKRLFKQEETDHKIVKEIEDKMVKIALKVRKNKELNVLRERVHVNLLKLFDIEE